MENAQTQSHYYDMLVALDLWPEDVVVESKRSEQQAEEIARTIVRNAFQSPE